MAIRLAAYRPTAGCFRSRPPSSLDDSVPQSNWPESREQPRMAPGPAWFRTLPLRLPSYLPSCRQVLGNPPRRPPVKPGVKLPGEERLPDKMLEGAKVRSNYRIAPRSWQFRSNPRHSSSPCLDHPPRHRAQSRLQDVLIQCIEKLLGRSWPAVGTACLP